MFLQHTMWESGAATRSIDTGTDENCFTARLVPWPIAKIHNNQYSIVSVHLCVVGNLLSWLVWINVCHELELQSLHIYLQQTGTINVVIASNKTKVCWVAYSIGLCTPKLDMQYSKLKMRLFFAKKWYNILIMSLGTMHLSESFKGTAYKLLPWIWDLFALVCTWQLNSLKSMHI